MRDLKIEESLGVGWGQTYMKVIFSTAERTGRVRGIRVLQPLDNPVLPLPLLPWKGPTREDPSSSCQVGH